MGSPGLWARSNTHANCPEAAGKPYQAAGDPGMAFRIFLGRAVILQLVSTLPGKSGLRLRPMMIFVVDEELGVTRANTCCAALWQSVCALLQCRHAATPLAARAVYGSCTKHEQGGVRRAPKLWLCGFTTAGTGCGPDPSSHIRESHQAWAGHNPFHVRLHYAQELQLAVPPATVCGGARAGAPAAGPGRRPGSGSHVWGAGHKHRAE